MVKGYVPKEDEEQATFVRWLELHNICYTHVPNGGLRNKITGYRLKVQGVQPGVPDILIFDTPPISPDAKGVAIEMKRRSGGQLTKNQESWLAKLGSRGWIARVCHGANEAINLCTQLGFNAKNQGRRSRGNIKES